MIEIQQFIERQLAQWPMARDNFDALNSIQTRIVNATTYGDDQLACVYAQHNPTRIVSTGAKVDAASLKARPCFLCEANRPPEQFGLDCGKYTILINPFPIFPGHLTIPAKEHVPQLISGRIADMGEFAKSLPGYTIFYNGAKCGASAPDHMHFQGVLSANLPLWCWVKSAEVDAQGYGCLAETCLPGILLVVADNTCELELLTEKVMSLLGDMSPSTEPEPMLNALCKYEDGKYTLAIIPRKKHRPDFYGSDEGQMLLSPASIDLAGVLIMPRKNDFEKIDKEILQDTYRQLCYTADEIKILINQLK